MELAFGGKAFKYANSFEEGLAVVLDEIGYGFLNKEGSFASDKRFKDIDDFYEDRAAAEDEGGWGFIDREFNFISHERFVHVGRFKGGKAPVGKTLHTEFFIDKQGNMID